LNKSTSFCLDDLRKILSCGLRITFKKNPCSSFGGRQGQSRLISQKVGIYLLQPQ
jgi:hypothetical protein